MITIQAEPGSTVGEVAVTAVETAVRMGCAVGMRHNATTITVYPADSINDALARFDDADRTRRLELHERDERARRTVLRVLRAVPVTTKNQDEIANAIRWARASGAERAVRFQEVHG